MSKLRISLASFFGLFALASIWIAGKQLLEYRGVVSLHAPWLTLLRLLLVGILPTIFAIFFGAAWWTILEDGPSAEKWGIVASLQSILLCLPTFYRGFDGLSDSMWIVFAIGITGLLVFSRRKVTGRPAVNLATLEPMTGDGTSTGPHLDE
jgi:hypothetical protein